MVKDTMDFHLIFYYKNTGKYALNVVAGALDSHPNTKNVPVEFITSHSELIDAINRPNHQDLRVVACVDFLYGLPGETKKDAMASLKLSLKLSEMGAKIHNHTFMPLPGTPFRDQLPGNINQEVQQQIVKLTSQGKAYGKWQGQIKVAKQLAEMRNGNKL